jgi:Family of unknown function (DUF6491)
MRLFISIVVAVAGLSTASAMAQPATPTVPAPAVAASPAKAEQLPKCFRISEWNGWRSPDPKTLYIRVGSQTIWKIGLASECSMLRSTSTHLVTKVRTSDVICAPIDLDLSVQDSGGFIEGCFVDSIRPLTPAEAAALEPKNRP